MPHVFVYGTLLATEMIEAIVRRVPKSRPAELKGYRRRRLGDCIYPAVVPDDQEDVAGTVYFDLTDVELARLDFFEGPEYQRRTVRLDAEGIGVIKVEAYVLVDAEQDRLTDEPWDPQQFRQQNLEPFVAVARQTMLRYESGDRQVIPPR